MDTTLIEEIHERDGKFVLAITGGGVSALAELLSVPGASNTVLSAFVPYHADELSQFIGGIPDQSCSSKTARALAMAAFQRARSLETEEPVFGLGCTAALATTRERRGDDRCYIAIQSSGSSSEVSVNFDKERRTRSEEEKLCTSLLLDFIARSLGIDHKASDHLRTTDEFTRNEIVANKSWQSLLSGEIKSTLIDESPELIFPGAFNPLHQGHFEMIRYAEEVTGKTASLEISIFNVDKPPLDFIEMQSRQDALEARPLVFTNAPTFVEKCRIFQGATFIVGTDTLSRIAETKYYDESTDQRDSALKEMQSSGTKFLVFGRRSENEFIGFDNLTLPDALTDMCIKVPEEHFSMDISSTEIRASQN